MRRQFIEPSDLTEFVGTVFGSSRKLTAVDRLVGGTQKGVYRLTLDDGETSILYAWSDAENYWPASDPSSPDPAGPPGAGAIRSRPPPESTCSSRRRHG